jgi:succinoglycan biosynthesis transport protein ExoP
VSATPYVEDPLSIRQILITLWRRKWLLAGIFIATLVAAHFMISSLTPRYAARSMLVLNVPGQVDTTEDGTGDPGPGRDLPITATQVQILQSTALTTQVVQALNLIKDPEFNPTLRPKSWLDSLVGEAWHWGMAKVDPGYRPPAPAPALPPEAIAQITVAEVQRHLMIENDGKSFVLTITCTATEPEKAAQIVNTLVNLYMKDQITARDQQAAGVSQWLDGKLVDLRQKQINADKAVQQYREAAKINDVPAGTSTSPLSSIEILNMSQALIAAQTARASAESELDNASALGADGGGSVSSTSSPLAQEVRDLRDQLHTLEQRRAEFVTQYGPNHPTMRALQANIAQTREALGEAQQRVADALATQVRIDKSREADLNDSMKGLQNEYHRNSRSAVELGALQSEADAARNVLQTFMVEALKASTRVETQAADVRVLAPAEVPQLPSFPNAQVLNSIAIIVGLLLALLGVIIAESFDKGLRDSDEVELQFGIPVLGMLPQFRKGVPALLRQTRLPSLPAPIEFMESVRSVGTAIGVNGSQRKGRIISVTSVLPREGKTTFSAELARMLADEGEDVLIIDCDWRRPSLAVHFSVDHALTVADAADSTSLHEQAGRDLVSGVSVLPAGRGGARNFNRGRFETVIEKARREYDVVILDCPQLGVVNDPLLPARFADAVILVVQWGTTPQALVRATLRKFQAAKIVPLGIVLSKVNFDWMARYRFATDTYGHFTRYISGRG